MNAGLPLGIKSQPVYHALDWDGAGRSHLLWMCGLHDEITSRLFLHLPEGRVKFIFCGAPDAPETPAPVHLEHARSLEPALAELERNLQTANMGLRLYLAGPEDDIWQAHAIAVRYGMGPQEVKLYRTGSLARPVFCVHCRAVTRGVRTNLVECSGCQRTLFVRDHFSRRLGAYMGFQIDAEVPGQKPAVETLFP
jgi:hypothetical protein